MDNASLKKQSAYLKSISNFYRIQILNLLLQGEKNVSTINKSVKVSQPALSQHLGKLRRAGIIDARRQQREIYYFIFDTNIVRILGAISEVTK